MKVKPAGGRTKIWLIPSFNKRSTYSCYPYPSTCALLYIISPAFTSIENTPLKLRSYCNCPNLIYIHPFHLSGYVKGTESRSNQFYQTMTCFLWFRKHCRTKYKTSTRTLIQAHYPYIQAFLSYSHLKPIQYTPPPPPVNNIN